jgi:hypothetical protein
LVPDAIDRSDLRLLMTLTDHPGKAGVIGKHSPIMIINNVDGVNELARVRIGKQSSGHIGLCLNITTALQFCGS